MKNPTLRTLISTLLISLVSGIVVLIIGFIRGWKTFTQFSDGFFYAGAIFLLIGALSLMGRIYQSDDPRMRDSQSSVHPDNAEQNNLWEAEIFHSHKLAVFTGISGVLLFGLAGLAILVGRLF